MIWMLIKGLLQLLYDDQSYLFSFVIGFHLYCLCCKYILYLKRILKQWRQPDEIDSLKIWPPPRLNAMVQLMINQWMIIIENGGFLAFLSARGCMTSWKGAVLSVRHLPGIPGWPRVKTVSVKFVGAGTCTSAMPRHASGFKLSRSAHEQQIWKGISREILNLPLNAKICISKIIALFWYLFRKGPCF